MPEDDTATQTQTDTTKVDPKADEGNTGDEKDKDKDGTTLLAESKPETKPDDSQTTDKEDKSDKPVEYSLKLKEGSLLHEGSVGEITEFAKKHKLSNEQAQEILDHQSKAINGYLSRVKNEVETWKEETRKDKEIGGEHLNETITIANRLLDKYDTNSEFRDLLEQSGLGNNVKVLRFLRKVGKPSMEGSLLRASDAPKPQKDPLTIMYDKTPQET
jgi:hypothetical protein